MSINALDIRAATTVDTRRHTSNKLERANLVGGGLVVVRMRAVVAVRTLAAEIMDIAHFDLLDAVDFGFVVVAAGRVDALALAVAGDDFFAVHGAIVLSGGLRRGRSGGFGGPVHRFGVAGFLPAAVAGEGRGGRRARDVGHDMRLRWSVYQVTLMEGEGEVASLPG